MSLVDPIPHIQITFDEAIVAMTCLALVATMMEQGLLNRMPHGASPRKVADSIEKQLAGGGKYLARAMS